MKGVHMAKVKKKAAKEYVVGYAGKNQCVYGPDRDGRVMIVDRMTMTGAVRRIRKLLSLESKAQIFRLVPVATKTVAEWKKLPAKKAGGKKK